MIPLPKTPLTLPKGTKLMMWSGEAITLLMDTMWDGNDLGPCNVSVDLDPTGKWVHLYTYIPGRAVRPTHYEVIDYPWRVLDSNGQHKLWEAVVDGEYYQCVAPIGLDAARLHPSMLAGWRAELGQVGWRYTRGDGEWSYSSTYITRSFLPPESPPAPEPPPAHPSPRPRLWPTRSDRVSILVLEMSTPLAERMNRVKR